MAAQGDEQRACDQLNNSVLFTQIAAHVYSSCQVATHQVLSESH